MGKDHRGVRFPFRHKLLGACLVLGALMVAVIVVGADSIETSASLLQAHQQNPQTVEELRLKRRFFLWMSTAGIAIGICLVVFVSRSLSRRILQLSTKAQRLAEGHEDLPLHVRGNDEIADLASSFNSMCVNIKKRQEELRSSHEEYRLLVENLKQEYFFYGYDLRGGFNYVSPSITDVLGYSQDDFMQNFADYLADCPDKQEFANFRRWAQQDNPTVSHFHIQLVHRDGEPYWFEVSEAPMFNDAGELMGIGGIAHDITERKRMAQVIQEVNQELEQRVEARTAELLEANRTLKQEIAERIQTERELEEMHRRLQEASHLAGMSEVATGVLHNVGNVLNSVNVSAHLIFQAAQRLKVGDLSKTATLLGGHDLSAFFAEDSKGKLIPEYLTMLAQCLRKDRETILEEVKSLKNNIEHIKDIVTTQQGYAGIAGVVEKVEISDVVEDALRMNAGSLAMHDTRVVREYEAVPPVLVEKHKMLQILVNLIRNASDALESVDPTDRRLVVRIRRATDEQVQIDISDNGMGIAGENLIRIFSHGFTTKKGGLGFGLHISALSAKQMDGSLTAHSDGIGKGATFRFCFPIEHRTRPDDQPPGQAES